MIIARLLRTLAIAVAVHGVVFAVSSAVLGRAEHSAPEAVGEIYFYAVLAPALILAVPFRPLLWHFHLMEAPGWFAWPKPGGFALAYAVWILVLFALSLILQKRRSA